MKLSLDQVRSWRVRRQFLDRPEGTSAERIVQRLCGVQAQVASAAEQAVAARRPSPGPGEAGRALQSRTLIKVWSMRGTLHLLPAADAGAYLSLLAAARTWEKGSWQKSFATTAQIAAIAEATREVLHGAVLTREQLTARILERTRDDSLTRRALVSKAAGWISPVVVHGGRVAGTWEPGDDGLTVALFPEAGPVPEADLAAEADRLGFPSVRRSR